MPPDIGALTGQFDALGVPPAPAVPPTPPLPLAPPVPPVFRMHCQSRRPPCITQAHVSVPYVQSAPCSAIVHVVALVGCRVGQLAGRPPAPAVPPPPARPPTL